jgi:putative FmdB family regulatory protein
MLVEVRFVPIYEYICGSCKKQYEAIVLSAETEVKCPKCGSAKKTLQLSVFAKPAAGNGSPSAKESAAAPRCMGNPSACGCR